MATYLAQGIVLKRRAYREHDRIVTIMTDAYGKIDAVARGVRKPTSKLAGHLEPFSYSAFMFATGRVFDVLATSIKQSSFRIPQTDLLSFGLVSYFYEAVDVLTRPRLPDRELFHLLVSYLHDVEESLDPHGGSPVFQRILLTELYLVQLIKHLGFAPLLDQCVIGHEPFVTSDGLSMSLRHSGLVCERHRPSDETPIPLKRQTVEVLRLMNDGHVEALRFIEQSSESLQEATRSVNDLLTHHIGAPLAARSFVRSLLRPAYAKPETSTQTAH